MRNAGVNLMVKQLLSVLALAGGLAPIAAQAQDEVVYYHTDAIGSVRMITDASGVEIARYDFLPFGEMWPPPQNPPDVRQYAGEERDTETKLDYFGARYFRAEAGRFTTVDPVVDIAESLTNPQRWNRYAYALNNPITVVDPDGRDPVKNQLGTVADMQRIFSQAGKTQLKFAWIDIRKSPVAGPPKDNPDAAFRYILLRDGGVVDMQHFLAAASLAITPSSTGDPLESVGMANVAGFLLEVWQRSQGSESAFAPEDLRSNELGAFFALHYDRTKALGPQLANFLLLQGAIPIEQFQKLYPKLYRSWAESVVWRK